MGDRVVFLDLDGPLFTDPVIKQQCGIAYSDELFLWFSRKYLNCNVPIDYIYMDEAAIDILNLLATEYSFKVVISSSWYIFLKEKKAFEDLFAINHLNLNFHEDWHTPRNMSSNRLREISQWINDHPNTDWIAIDDMFSGSSLTDSYVLSKMNMDSDRIIIVDTEVGLCLKDLQNIRKIWQ